MTVRVSSLLSLVKLMPRMRASRPGGERCVVAPLGLALIGLAAARSQVFERMPGVLLAVRGPLFLGLEGPFMPIAVAVSASLFGIAQMWWGWLMWRSAAMPEPHP